MGDNVLKIGLVMIPYHYAKLRKHNEMIKYLENKMFYEKLSKYVN